MSKASREVPRRGTLPGVPSPCISVCVLDPASRRCLGCYRTVEEIANWSVMDDEAKRAVWAALPGRREEEGAA